MTRRRKWLNKRRYRDELYEAAYSFTPSGQIANWLKDEMYKILADNLCRSDIYGVLHGRWSNVAPKPIIRDIIEVKETLKRKDFDFRGLDFLT